MHQNQIYRRASRGAKTALITILAILGTASAHADMIEIVSESSASTEGLGAFTGSLNYEFNAGANYWELTVTLTNTSPAANGGFITGFIFNIESSDSNAMATLVSGTHPFQNAPFQSGSPFGAPYRSGAALGGNWLGSGGASQGIAVGDTGVFKFSVAASDAALLTASSFMNGPYEFDFVVRYRAFNDDGSDKVPAVPGPAVLTIMALSLAFPLRRRRRY